MERGNGVGKRTSRFHYKRFALRRHFDLSKYPFYLPNKNARENPVSYQDLDYVRQSIVNGQDIVDGQSYDDVYTYHAGATLRIKQKKQLTGVKDYSRYTDYETACVGVRYNDSNGGWERVSFTSQSDGVSITKISASDTG